MVETADSLTEVEAPRRKGVPPLRSGTQIVRILALMKPGQWYTVPQVNRMVERSGIVVSRYFVGKMFHSSWRAGRLRKARIRGVARQVTFADPRPVLFKYRLGVEIESRGLDVVAKAADAAAAKKLTPPKGASYRRRYAAGFRSRVAKP